MFKQIIFLFWLISAVAWTAERRLSGKVVDAETNLPLAGVSVVIGDSRIGAVTDHDGRFVIANIPLVDFYLEARMMGYLAQKMQILSSGSAAPIVLHLQQTVVPLQNLLITASRMREEPVMAGYANLRQDQIQERYTVQDIPVLLSELPSATFYSESGNGIGYTYLNIRGFDQRRIAVMVNGVPQNDPEDHMVYWLDFPDLAANLENIQVQRGAGNLWAGNGAIGGAINLISSNFTRQRGISVFCGGGGFNTRKYSLSASSGLLDNRYAIYARLGKMTSDGYRKNSWIDFNSYFLGVARFDENLTTQINLYGGPVADHLAYYGVSLAEARDRKLRRNNPIKRKEEIENFSQPHYELFNEWQKGAWKIQNTLFYVLGEGFYDYDGSWAPYGYYRITPENGFAVSGNPDELFLSNALIHALVKNQQWGWLPRAVWTHRNGSMTFGGEWRQHRSFHSGSLKWGAGMPDHLTPDYVYYEYRGAKNMTSLFINETFKAGDRLTLLADAVLVGNRYRLYDEKYLHHDFSTPFRFFNPKVGAGYQINDRIKIYSTFARTSREPRLKNLYDAAEASTPAAWGAVTPQFELKENGQYDFSRPLVKPETMYDWEVGGSYDGAYFQLAADIYHMNFKNEIVKSGQLDRFGQPVTGNAEKTEHRGIELQALLRPTAHLEFSVNATYSRNRLIHYRRYTWDRVQALDGNPIAGFPDILANGRLSWRSNAFSLSLAGRYVGAFYTSNNAVEEQKNPAFTVFDLYAQWRLPGTLGWPGLTLQVQINNLFDKLYTAHGEGDEFFPAATRHAFVGLNLEL